VFLPDILGAGGTTCEIDLGVILQFPVGKNSPDLPCFLDLAPRLGRSRKISWYTPFSLSSGWYREQSVWFYFPLGYRAKCIQSSGHVGWYFTHGEPILRSPCIVQRHRYARSRNQATACRSPSSTGYCGSYPNASRARVMSASESRMSPARVAS
jgi:hypothetical protein